MKQDTYTTAKTLAEAYAKAREEMNAYGFINFEIIKKLPNGQVLCKFFQPTDLSKTVYITI